MDPSRLGSQHGNEDLIAASHQGSDEFMAAMGQSSATEQMSKTWELLEALCCDMSVESGHRMMESPIQPHYELLADRVNLNNHMMLEHEENSQDKPSERRKGDNVPLLVWHLCDPLSRDVDPCLQDAVNIFSLQQAFHPVSYTMVWLKEGIGIRILHRFLVSFSIGFCYQDHNYCGVAPRDVCTG